VKRQRREADHLPPFNAEVKKDRAIHSPIYLHGVVLKELSTGTTLPLCYTPQDTVILTENQALNLFFISFMAFHDFVVSFTSNLSVFEEL
jgi:hypothetical protein